MLEFRPLLWTLCCLFPLSSALAGTEAGTYDARLESLQVLREGPYWVSEWKTFEIPAGLQSFQLLILAPGGDSVQITDLIDPAGKAWVTSGGGGNPPKLHAYSQPVLRNAMSPNRTGGVTPGTGTLIVPNNPSLGAPPAGTWTFRTLSSQKPEKISVWIRGKSLEEKSTRIPLRLWIAKKSPWSRDLQAVDKVVEMSRKMFAEAGLQVEIISTLFLEEEIPQGLEVPGEVTGIALRKNKPDAVNVYLMPAMNHQSVSLNGLACIGGPAGIAVSHGCFVSLYATEALSDLSLEKRAKVLTHEISHYLGLFHPKDEYPLIGKALIVHDSLEDTHEEMDGTNLMDTGLHETVPVFSPQQVRMLRLSPALR